MLRNAVAAGTAAGKAAEAVMKAGSLLTIIMIILAPDPR
jgi:F0F1-type ATP synthase membrane subunit c/vacuolar-type H+-ATPase subunit K